MNVISIVPRLPPAVDGVGDYALCLARQLRTDYGVETQFIVGDPDWDGPSVLEEFQVRRIEDRSADSLRSTFSDLKQDSQTAILVHLSGYGYERWSLYNWLVDGLEKLHVLDDKIHIVTMFHEVYNTYQSILSHSTWVRFLQKKLASRLMRLSNSCVTNSDLYRKMMSELVPSYGSDITVAPVPSSIGELLEINAIKDRNKYLVVFGQGGTRRRVYTESRRDLEETCVKLGIEKVIDIGPPILIPKLEIEVLQLGKIDSKDVSQILSTSFCAAMSYHPGNISLAKSSIWAAYCSHGLLPISFGKRTYASDGLIPGDNYWTPSVAKNNVIDLQIIASKSNQWYKNHDLSSQSILFYKILARIKEGVESST
jgi:hypothetical protein